MNKSRISPFEQLLRSIEDEIYNFSLELQLKKEEKLNTDFCLGYRCALNYMLERAYAIYYRKYPENFIPLDMRTEQATLQLIVALLKKRG